jgi:thioesterase domain-containing protein
MHLWQGNDIYVLKHGGSKEPLFVLPDLGGNSLYTKKILPRLVEGRPVLAFRLKSASLPAETVETIAEKIAMMIAKEYPRQRHHLLGHSFAGFLAYETAKALERLGANVGRVFLLDTPVPRHDVTHLPSWLAHWTRLAFRRLNSPASSEGYLFKPGYIAIDLNRHPAAYREIIRSLYSAMTRYTPKPFCGSIVLFRSTSNGIGAGRTLGWSRLVRGDIEVIDIGGTHLDMVRDDERANFVAQKIETLLEERLQS